MWRPDEGAVTNWCQSPCMSRKCSYTVPSPQSSPSNVAFYHLSLVTKFKSLLSLIHLTATASHQSSHPSICLLFRGQPLPLPYQYSVWLYNFLLKTLLWFLMIKSLQGEKSQRKNFTPGICLLFWNKLWQFSPHIHET